MGELTFGVLPSSSSFDLTHQSLPSESSNFRTVLWTGQYSQVVLMTIPPGEFFLDGATEAMQRARRTSWHRELRRSSVLFFALTPSASFFVLVAGGDIGDEVHTVDQALTFTSGVGTSLIRDAGRERTQRRGLILVLSTVSYNRKGHRRRRGASR